MTPLDALSPDQRAVLQLVLKQGKRYEDLAALLRSEPGSVRTRAIAALDALAPAAADLSVGRRGELADWLLGQQDPAESEQTIAYLRGSESGRRWVLTLEEQLQEAGLEPAPARTAAEADAQPPATEPEEPAAEPEQPAASEAEPEHEPEPQPEPEAETALAERPGDDDVTTEFDRAEHQTVEAPVEAAAAALADDGDQDRERRRLPGFAAGATRQQPTSRLGGALLLAGVAIVLAVALIWILSSGDDNSSKQTPAAAQTQAQSTTKTTAQPTIAGQVNLRGKGKALGVANVLAQGDQRALAIQAQGLTPNTKRDAYAVWLTDGPAGKATRLGFAPAVGKNGRLEGATGLPADANRYQRLVISRETQADPSLPGTEVLSGRINVR